MIFLPSLSFSQAAYVAKKRVGGGKSKVVRKVYCEGKVNQHRKRQNM